MKCLGWHDREGAPALVNSFANRSNQLSISPCSYLAGRREIGRVDGSDWWAVSSFEEVTSDKWPSKLCRMTLAANRTQLLAARDPRRSDFHFLCRWRRSRARTIDLPVADERQHEQNDAHRSEKKGRRECQPSQKRISDSI